MKSPLDPDRLVESLALTNWAQAFSRPPTDAILDGLLIPGRWTALVAPAKAGKSTLALHIAHCLARGLDPFTGTSRDPIAVLYLDGEMGELDVIERLIALDLTPADLGRLHYTDMPPKCDVVPGAVAVETAAKALAAQVVIFDGLNAFVTGAENDDTTWRPFFDLAVSALKRAGCAVLSLDNTGHSSTDRSRGSTVKIDKPDACIELKKTDNGLKLKSNGRVRTSAFLREVDLTISGIDDGYPITYRYCSTSWPAGTADVVAAIDRLALPDNAGRPVVQAALKAAGERIRTEVLAAAIRFRKARITSGTPTGTPTSAPSGTPTGTVQ